MSSFNRFKHQLDSALDLLENSEQIKQLDLPQVLGAQMVDTESLLSRCTHICDKHKQKKPVIRIVHHLACSGGTLVSKCISAMPNVYLLSELHPSTSLDIDLNNPVYKPTDLISLSKYSGIPNQNELTEKLFLNGIKVIHQHVDERGGILVLRDHTHADYCTNVPIPQKSTLLSLLEQDFDVKSVLTIRDPIDAYASLVKNNWVHFEPATFDEYCRRVLLLVNSFDMENIFSYQKLTESPLHEMKKLCEALDIPFDDSFEDTFGIFAVTGDSGRSSNVIGQRRRMLENDMIDEFKQSENYIMLINALSKYEIN